MDLGQVRGGADPTPRAGQVAGRFPLGWAGASEIRYAESEDGYVAYQIFGTGPHDVLFIGNWASFSSGTGRATSR